MCGCFILFNADLGLDVCSQPAEGLQEGLVLWFEGGTSLHILESHVQFAELLQSLATPVQGFNICCININCYMRGRKNNNEPVAFDLS